MKTHEQINYACSKGLYPIVQKEDGRVCIFSPHKDMDGDYRYSGWSNTQKEAEKYISNVCGYILEEMEEQSQEQNWKIIGYYDTPYKRYEVGEKVVDKNSGDVGVILEVDNYNDETRPYKINVLGGYYYRGHNQLLPYFDTTPSEEEIEKAKKTLEDAGLLVDGKVLKK